MQLQLNYEGEQYIIGIPLKDKPEAFIHHIIEASLLDWVTAHEGNITSFPTLGQARQAIDSLKAKGWFREKEQPRIYKVIIARSNNEDFYTSS